VSNLEYWRPDELCLIELPRVHSQGSIHRSTHNSAFRVLTTESALATISAALPNEATYDVEYESGEQGRSLPLDCLRRPVNVIDQQG
jgi:hypothetical protein